MVMSIFWLQQKIADLPTGDSWLCANEVVRLGSMRFAKRRADWRLGRWTAKCAVAAYLGWPSATPVLRSIEIRPIASGAPEVFIGGQCMAIGVSLSHSNAVAMAAVAGSGVAVGCDLELIEPRTDGFLADYFTSEEQMLVRKAPVPDRSALVTLLWSAKESALKALGRGLRLDTRTISVDVCDSKGISDHAAEGFHMPRIQRTQQPAWGHGQDGWRALEVFCSNGGGTLYGWWQATSDFVRTLVTDARLLPPVLLDLRL